MPAIIFRISPNEDGKSFNVRAFECDDLAGAVKKMEKLKAKDKKKKKPAKKPAKKK